MMEKGEGFKNKFKGKKRPFNNTNDESNKTPKGACQICGKTGHLKANCKVGKHKKKKAASTSQGGKGSNDQDPPTNQGQILDIGFNSVVNYVPLISEAFYVQDDVVAWWIDSGATNHVCKDRHWFKYYELVKDGSVQYMGNESTAPIVYRFYVIEPNYFVSVHTVIESRDAIFDESRFSSMPKPKDLVPSSSGAIEGSDNVTTQEATPEIRRSKRKRIAKSFGPDFLTYLVEGSRDGCENYYPYCFHIDEDPRTFDEVMRSHDSSFWKEAVNDEMDSIMGNNTWVLADLPRGCKPLGCKWIFKKKMKVDGSIDKFKARLVIQGFRQKEGIDYFDTYAPVARITTIRLLIALAAINNLVIHQMDVKMAFLNGELKDEVYMKQPERFIMPGNEHKVCKLIKSLYGLKQAPEQWHHKFDEVVLSNGYRLNQSDKCVYSKFDDNGNGVIICLYVDNMLIFWYRPKSSRPYLGLFVIKLCHERHG
ncbi:uncharacterized protein LOC141631838 [Silene latifolia]|uniref:uncharacterized protein LOC141631838 n=1 Tax=Silene latifolia TaxID=37657 RepID=UPI003D783819